MAPRAIAQGSIAQSACGNCAGVKRAKLVTHLLLLGIFENEHLLSLDMGLFEWLLVALFVLYGMQIYRRQVYSFDRFISLVIKQIKDLLRSK